MKCFGSFVCFLSVLVIVASAPYFPAGGSFSASTSLQLGGSSGTSSSGGGANGLTNILSNIDLPSILRGVNSFVKLVGVFCPPLSQVLDNVIQNVTSTAFRVFGSAILRSGGLGGGGGGGGGQKVSVVLPTFPPDDDEDDEDEDTDVGDDASESNAPITSSNNFDADLLSRSKFENSTESEEESKGPNGLSLSVQAEASSSSSSDASSSSASDKSDGLIPVSEIRLPEKETEEVSTPETASSSESTGNPATLFTSPANEDSNAIAKRHVRVTREAAEEDDQDGAESAPQPAEDLAQVDDQDRNKRFLPFGGSVEAHAGDGGHGSGNFLFDIIRLVAGSGATEEHDEKVNAPGGIAEVDIQKSHEAYTGEGIPGPITRLFVIANRGLANLVQDLILRLAATSEKIVNFKARLITSLI